jgi:hypothetical protein
MEVVLQPLHFKNVYVLAYEHIYIYKHVSRVQEIYNWCEVHFDTYLYG